MSARTSTRAIWALVCIAGGATACADDGVARDDGGTVGLVDGAISGGYASVSDTAVVGVVRLGGGGLGICSGSLIAPNLVLTAQHCVAPTLGQVQGGVSCQQTHFGTAYAPGSMYVTTRAHMSNDPAIYRSVREVIVPDDGDDGFCGRDIALMVLSDVVADSEATPLVPRVDEVLIGGTSWQSSNGEGYSAVGYGNTSDGGGGSGERRRRDDLNVTCVHQACPAYAVDSREWVGDTGVCEGDSGGPAIDLDGRVVGVASRGGADCSTPIYSSVQAWGAWVTAQALYAADLGAYEAPPWARGWPTNPAYYASVGGDCSTNGQCGAGFCIDGACTRACDALATCPGGYGCDGGRCAVIAIGQACADGAGCGAGTCRDGFCTRECGESLGCPDGYVCDGTCALAPIGQECGGPDACATGLCRDGRCTRACGDEAPCAAGYVCDGGSCGLLPVGDTCGDEGGCGAGACRDGYCTRACGDQAPCPNGYACEDGVGQCALIAVGGACADDGVCGAGFCGPDGLCTRGCDDLAPCAPGFLCDGGACLLASVGGACEDDDACAGGLCADGSCTRACSDLAPCPDGHRCGGDGTCVALDEGCSAARPAQTVGWLAAFATLALLGWRRRRRDVIV